MSKAIAPPIRRICLLFAAAIAVLVTSALAPTAVIGSAHAAGVGQYSAPEWFPLRQPAMVGCALDNCSGPHHGYWAVDFLDPLNQKGDPIYAAGAGRVRVISRNNDCRSDAGRSYPGNYLMVDHGYGRESYYFHLDSFAVEDLAWVDQNTVLGYMGSTGNASPSCPVNHLHFEIKINGTRIDPVHLKACYGAVPITYPEALGKTTWNDAKGATVASSGTECGSIRAYAGKLVKRADEPASAWFVTPDLRRLWVPDQATFDCLRLSGLPEPEVLPAEVLTSIPDETGKWMPCGDTLLANRVLRRGMTLKSADGKLRFALQTDGNLVLYGSTGVPLWAHYQYDTDYAIMQSDGNLVTYRANRTANWSSGTWGSGATHAKIENNGSVAVYQWVTQKWSTGTAGLDPGLYVGGLVKSPDPGLQNQSWFVAPDGKRLWVPDVSTYNCLRAGGIAEPAAVTAWTFAQLPDQNCAWVPCGPSLQTNRVLRRGMTVWSANGEYRLSLQTDGNLVLYSKAGRALWANYQFDTAHAIMQIDGNFVTYRSNGTANWSTRTWGSGATRIEVQSDGNLVVYAGTVPKWWTGTRGRG